MSNRFKLTALVLAIVFIYGIAIPFIMSDEADRLIIQYGLDDFARQLLGR
jgi:hypothetical protein